MDAKKLRRIVDSSPQFSATRKVSLYSNFSRLQESNPDGYEANVQAWTAVLREAVIDKVFRDAVCLEAGPELLRALADPKNGLPMSLNVVLEQMVEERSLVPLRWYLSMTAYPVLTGSWRPGYLVKRAALWAASRIIDMNWKASNGTEEIKQEKYVCVECLKERSQALHAAIKKAVPSNQILSLEDVEDLGESIELSQLDVLCCLLYLSRETSKLAFDRIHGVVKLPEGSSSRAPVIHEEDIAIVSIRSQQVRLQTRALLLSTQLQEISAKAKDAVKKGNTQEARRIIARKSSIVKALDSTSSLSEQLETILSKIDDARNNHATAAVLEQSKSALQNINRSVEAGKVSQLIDSIQDEIADVDSVAGELGSLNLHDEDQEELDAELDSMLREETEKNSADILDKLPSVPSQLPGGRPEQPEQPEERQKKEERVAEERVAV